MIRVIQWRFSLYNFINHIYSNYCNCFPVVYKYAQKSRKEKEHLVISRLVISHFKMYVKEM
jgi:hypothetical protein